MMIVWCLTPLSTLFQLYRGGSMIEIETELLGRIIEEFLLVEIKIGGKN